MPTDPIHTITGIRLHCPVCGGGPADIPVGGEAACFDCRAVVKVTGAGDGWFGLKVSDAGGDDETAGSD